jgi:hypothetical protein
MKNSTDKINQADTAELPNILNGLIDGWCARRALRPLRVILQVYPLANSLSDDWHALYDGLRDIRFPDLTSDEQDQLQRAILLTQFVIYPPK